MTLNYLWSFFCFIITASAVKVLYPSINSSETLNCLCPDHQCQKVNWYRLLQDSDTPEFILSANNINFLRYGANIAQSRYKPTASDSSGKVVYTLRITGILKNETGFYSCLLVSQNSAQDPKDLMPTGYSIRPGESITTLAPPTTKKHIHKNRSPKICKSKSLKGCQSLVLWSGIGAVLLLVVVLISTLYYFSRLPKKCRHRFEKTHRLR
ncbi:uncharacterized protein cd8b isoform 1-T1 [Clarias gariepinus]|uniref:uncharacterized protein cd8b isoform X1 n=1 Tax=Clarias gariepinus TaxID=13013 RepID=UPI00234C13E3|nr:uncharacterized protein cd8b isoform X1 [Clarias gariepinus]